MADGRLKAAGQALREVRKRAGFSGAELASRAGVTQPTVSRVENGRRVSTVDAVVKIIRALPFTQNEAERLAAEWRELYAATASEKRVDAGVSLVAGAGRKLLVSASEVRVFQDAMVPLLLQTPEYARARSGPSVPARDLGELLADEGRNFRFVVTESALRTWPGSGSFMAAQLAHLLAVVERPNVSLAVIPWGTGLPVLPPHGFTVCDQAGVLVETYTAEMTLTGTEHVSAYRDAFTQLEAVAVDGDVCRALVERVSSDIAKLMQ
ncbi:hypothetical protein BJF83_24135 [Nocardiopsis sp. CNR-923]|uniref:helix-turn-helix domain-containing protein n=1 Tax=Nocardiopsis sp. CNR-923 TaxID=1904965 RepID=UPI00095F8E84|nr:helix-turn-helix transcriptional regulator [Nocardiopsis sp. CNR-923]OLT24466.1 hypothetical protein BJF83_24135 [Nocardiopsis sp. CNR-923]